MTSYVVDANLTLLLVVGSYDIDLVGRRRHKRCSAFDERDFSTLDDLLQTAETVVCTPHAQAEASSLVRQIDDPLKMDLTAHFGLLASSFREAYEAYAPSREAVADVAYRRLGLTDASLLAVSTDLEILTTDLDLYIAALQRGQRATNFTHLRDMIAPYRGCHLIGE